MRVRKIDLYALTPFEKIRLVHVEEMFRYNQHPLHTVLIDSNGETKMTIKDVRNYHMRHTQHYFAILQKQVG